MGVLGTSTERILELLDGSDFGLLQSISFHMLLAYFQIRMEEDLAEVFNYS